MELKEIILCALAPLRENLSRKDEHCEIFSDAKKAMFVLKIKFNNLKLSFLK